MTSKTPPISISRRGFLKKGLIGAGLLFVAGAVPVALMGTRRGAAPRQPLRVFTPDEHAVFAAIANRMVPGPDAGPRWPSAEELDCAGAADAIMAVQDPAVAKEFRELLRLFENGLTGLATTGVPKPFTRCAPEQQVRRLEAWRNSRFGVLRTGYLALKRLSEATYYASPRTFALVGYPGPPSA